MQFDFLKNEKNTLFAGASSDSLKQVEKTLGISLPHALRDFLTFSDGALIAENVILFSAKPDPQNHEDLLSFNNKDTVQQFFRIGRFSSDEFGYLHDSLTNEDPAIFVLDHETEEFHKEAENISEFLEKYNNYVPPKKKPWYSFLFS